ncbi:amidophosphoribosyltransferase [Apilactobacillus xinyiensis]|uniref:amidophosphoribosyltransferase n=1 Tax=Apilactobacillus xinyiensis TaxID=2841032 RepID=UPI001C7D0A73|nr:amidophosphoribosyltransferase [Apilactobacillus xinyiensis]
MLNEVKSLNEECGLFGIWGSNVDETAGLIHDGLHSLQHRGQEGAGIVVTDDEYHIHRHRGLGLVSQVFADSHVFDDLKGNIGIGHVRYATAGSHGIKNIQPFTFHLDDFTDFSLAHNGNLTNADTLKSILKAKGASFNSDSDSEILGQLIKMSKQVKFIDRLKEALRQIKGGFAFILSTGNELIAALDPNGFRPLVIGRRNDGSYVVCSETCALDQVNATYIRDVKPGEVVIINQNGITNDYFTKETHLSICSMEYIYFARPDSIIHNVSVHEARMRMGALCAKENPIAADVVIGVPNSSLSAALGYSQGSGIPYDMGMIKSQYVARTFIEPTQKKRERGVSMKLSVVRSVVKGKKVVLVDDSIVRGTTSKYIVRLLKDAGAKEVHVRIASPALRFPCFYGIDIQTTEELIAANHTVNEIKDIIGADSLGYLSVASLVKAINLKNDHGEGSGLCTSYFDGQYPTPLYDYQSQFDKSAKKLGLYEEDNYIERSI